MRFGMGRNCVPWGVRGHLRSLSLGLERRVPRRALFRMMKVRGICSRLHARESAHVRQTSRVWNQVLVPLCKHACTTILCECVRLSSAQSRQRSGGRTRAFVPISKPTTAQLNALCLLRRQTRISPRLLRGTGTHAMGTAASTCFCAIQGMRSRRRWFTRCVRARMRHRRRGLRSPSQCLHCSLPAPS